MTRSPITIHNKKVEAKHCVYIVLLCYHGNLVLVQYILWWILKDQFQLRPWQSRSEAFTTESGQVDAKCLKGDLNASHYYDDVGQTRSLSWGGGVARYYLNLISCVEDWRGLLKDLKMNNLVNKETTSAHRFLRLESLRCG